MVLYIHEYDAVGLNMFKTSKLLEYFAVDTSHAYKNGRANPNHLFELFGFFSGHEAIEVYEILLEHIARNLDFHLHCSTVCLEMRNMVFSDWVKQLADGRIYCVEIGLLFLSTLYHRHTLVVISNKLWLTIVHPAPLNLLELLNECSVKLVYLGQLWFGELKQHPRWPPRPIPLKSSAKNTKTKEKEAVAQPAAPLQKTDPATASANAECVETQNPDVLHVQTKNGVQTVMHVETDDNSIHVETNQGEQSAWHVETLLVLHVAMTKETSSPTANTVQSDIVSNVTLDLPASKADEDLPAPTPFQQE